MKRLRLHSLKNYTKIMLTSDIKISESEVRTFLNKDKRIYLKKPKSWQRIYLWWENSECWFLNKAFSKKTKNSKIDLEKSSWITSNDLDNFISFSVRQGYEIYLTHEQNTV